MSCPFKRLADPNFINEIRKFNDRDGKISELTAAKTKAPLIARIAATTCGKSNSAAFELLIGLLFEETEAELEYFGCEYDGRFTGYGYHVKKHST